MFFVVNREKLYAYIVSIATVVMLFIMAGVLTPDNDTMEASANIQENIVMQKQINDNTNNSNE